MQLPTEHLTTVVAWLANHPELGAAVAALLMGGIKAARTYYKTGHVPLYTLPWRAARRLFYQLRKRYFTTPWPASRSRSLPATQLEAARTRLAQASYWVNWPLSYRYFSEDLNASRVFYDSAMEYPYRQMHIRVKETADGLSTHAHEEPHPWFHPIAHLRGREFFTANEWVVTQWTSGTLDPRSFERSTDGSA